MYCRTVVAFGNTLEGESYLSKVDVFSVHLNVDKSLQTGF